MRLREPAYVAGDFAAEGTREEYDCANCKPPTRPTATRSRGAGAECTRSRLDKLAMGLPGSNGWQIFIL